MDEAGRVELEGRVRAMCAAGEHDAAATAALKGLGREIYGFLVAMNRDEDAGEDTPGGRVTPSPV